MPVRTGDLDVVISALDRLYDYRVNISCDFHYREYRAGRTSRNYPSGLEELLEAYKGVWMKLERRKLCSAAMTQPHTQGNIFYHQAVGHSVPANNELLPNNAGSGGFPVNHQLARHFELEGNPICRSFYSESGDLTRNIADHRDLINPFQGFLTNQRNRAQSSLRNPFATQPDHSPAQEPRMVGFEDGGIISIESSDEEMMQGQLEHAPVVPQAPGGRRRKRKGQREKAQDRNRKRKFQAKKRRERRHGQGGQPHPLGPQIQGGSQGEAWRDTGNQPQPDSRFNPPTGPRAWRQQHGGRGTFRYEG
ncbi:uncharacterized protein FPRN_05590 [Fusarium proliferatum]|nr:uncharacterized protein FPRN_05590 [Fusarium proliferatum]